MRKLRKAKISEIEKQDIYVWCDEDGIATHNAVFGMWPVLCMGAKVLHRNEDAIETMEVSDEKYAEIQKLIDGFIHSADQ